MLFVLVGLVVMMAGGWGIYAVIGIFSLDAPMSAHGRTGRYRRHQTACCQDAYKDMDQVFALHVELR